MVRRAASPPPQPHHVHCPDLWCRGRDTSASAQCSLNASDTQPHSGRTVRGGRREVEDAPSATWHGGNTPQTPQTLAQRVLAAEESPDGSGRRIRQGWDRSDRGAFGRASTPWWMGAAGESEVGHDQGQVVIDHGKDDERSTLTEGGGCTLSRAPKPREVITYRNQINVDGNGGRESINSEENFRMRATRDHSTMNSVHLIKAGCGRGWARLSSKPGNPTTLSNFFVGVLRPLAAASTASQPDCLRTARRSVWEPRGL